MTPKAARWTALGVALLFLGLWSVPLVRAVKFIEVAREHALEAVSQDSVDDLQYAYSLFSSYLVSLLISFAVIAFLVRRPRPSGLWPLALLLWAVVRVLLARPEAPIHLIPTMLPITPVLICVGAAGLACWVARGGGSKES